MLSLVLICVYLLSYFTIGASFDLQFIFICKLVCLDQVQFYVFFHEVKAQATFDRFELVRWRSYNVAPLRATADWLIDSLRARKRPRLDVL